MPFTSRLEGKVAEPLVVDGVDAAEVSPDVGCDEPALYVSEGSGIAAVRGVGQLVEVKALADEDLRIFDGG